MIVVTASSAMYGAASEGNLSDRQLMIRIGVLPGEGDVAPIDERTAAELEDLGEVVAQIAVTLDATVIEVEVATASGFDEFEGLPAMVLGSLIEQTDEGTRYQNLSHVYVASPALLAEHGLDEAEVDPEADVLTTETGDLWLLPVRDEPVRESAAPRARLHLAPGDVHHP